MCKEPVELEALVGWWLGELASEPEAALEEHLFACATCSARAEALAALAGGVRAAVREGRVTAVVSGSFLEALRRQGLRIREYHVPAGGRVDCTITAEDDAVVSRLAAPLAGAKRIDLLQHLEIDGQVTEERVEDVPFDPAAGEVLFIPSAAWLRALPAHIVRMRLVAVDEVGEHALGEYTFAHTPG